MQNGRGTRAAIYGRVSTDGQTVDNQLRELRMVVERNGWQIVQEFVGQVNLLSLSTIPDLYPFRVILIVTTPETELNFF